MPVLRGIGLLATCRAEGHQGELHAIRDAALAWEGDRISWLGPEAELPEDYGGRPAWDAGGRLVVPGLVDAHTHLAFGGWRAEEFVARLRGRSYQEISRAGGGISATVRHTRALSEDELLERCLSFAGGMAELGVTTVEAKSGYGLDLDSELKLLRVYRRLNERGPVRVVPTFLGAHSIPAEWGADREGYLRLVIEEMLPAVAAEGLARFCDVFVEEGTAFTAEEGRRVLEAARTHGLGVKLHVDQLSDGGGAALAAELAGTSADHLEHVSDEGIRRLGEAGTVAVALPLASAYLDQAPMPARRLLDAGVPVAVATDFNPGTAPSYHLPLAMLLACVRLRMTPSEALKGATRVAARAIGCEDSLGSLEVGKAADFALIDAPDVDRWLYHFRGNACIARCAGGELDWRKD